MVDVSAKEVTAREAVARGRIRISAAAMRLVRAGRLRKGGVTEVARLAGRGLSDREIADDLVLSIRTVQSHLASAYRKLGITSLNELASLLP